MIPLLFFTLCVTFSGGEDCSYEWFVVNDFEFAFWWETYRTDVDPESDQHVGGFTVASERLVFIRQSPDSYLIGAHEAKHVICNVEFLAGNMDITELQFCHLAIDHEYLVQLRPDGYDDWHGITDNSPPKVTEKMAFHELMYSNQFISREQR